METMLNLTEKCWLFISRPYVIHVIEYDWLPLLQRKKQIARTLDSSVPRRSRVIVDAEFTYRDRDQTWCVPFIWQMDSYMSSGETDSPKILFQPVRSYFSSKAKSLRMASFTCPRKGAFALISLTDSRQVLGTHYNVWKLMTHSIASEAVLVAHTYFKIYVFKIFRLHCTLRHASQCFLGSPASCINVKQRHFRS